MKVNEIIYVKESGPQWMFKENSFLSLPYDPEAQGRGTST